MEGHARRRVVRSLELDPDCTNEIRTFLVAHEGGHCSPSACAVQAAIDAHFCAGEYYSDISWPGRWRMTFDRHIWSQIDVCHPTAKLFPASLFTSVKAHLERCAVASERCDETLRFCGREYTMQYRNGMWERKKLVDFTNADLRRVGFLPRWVIGDLGRDLGMATWPWAVVDY